MKLSYKILIIFTVLLLFSVSDTYIFKVSSVNSIEDMPSLYQEEILLINNGKYDEAIARLENTEKFSSKDVQRLNLLASAYASKGNASFKEHEYGSKALEMALESIKIDPLNYEGYRLAGYSYEIMEKYDEALKYYDLSIDLNPKNELAFASRGHTYDLMGEIEKAKKDYTIAYNLNKNDTFILQQLARIAIREGDSILAEKYVDQIIGSTNVTNRVLAEALYTKSSIALYLHGDLELSNKIADRIIEVDPNFIFGYVAKARALKDLNQNDQAQENLDKALSLYQDLSIAWEWKGLIEEKKGNLVKAEEYFNQAIQSAKTDIQLMANERESIKSRNEFYLSTTDARKGNRDVAMAKIENVLTSQMDPIIFSMLSEQINLGSSGLYANLMDESKFLAIMNSTKMESGLFAFIQKVYAEDCDTVNIGGGSSYKKCWPHGRGNSLDSTLHNIMERYFRNEISYSQAFKECDTKVKSVNRSATCDLKGNAKSNITIGCNNTYSGYYYPVPMCVD